MSQTLLFYDLETSGFSSRSDRIMQFGAQRTDMNLKPVGEPINILIKMSPDTLPSPDAIFVTGITPQKTIAEGISEAEFVKIFTESIATPDTIFVGFNSIRFDDEFMRFLLYRNYTDAYEWQWKAGRSRWDILDVVRMTRALRPDGIKWPMDVDGKPGNRLEMLTKVNKLEHTGAHDALSDVQATISLAQLLRSKQPKLFDYLLKIRTKAEAEKIVNTEGRFVYTSGRYSAEFDKTTVVTKFMDHPKINAAMVYDLRFDPTDYVKMSPDQLVEAWRYKKDSNEPRLPVKTLRFNRCPAIATESVLKPDDCKRLKIDLKKVKRHQEILNKNIDVFSSNVKKALEILDKQQQTKLVPDENIVDEQLYDGFVSDGDRAILHKVVNTQPEELTALGKTFSDPRLKAMMPLYKARNFAKHLDDQERSQWDEYVKNKLSKKIPEYFARLDELADQKGLSGQQQYLLEELRLYGESILPAWD